MAKKKKFTDQFFEKANEYFQKGSYRMAASYFKRSAEELCNDDSMVQLGILYRYGVGVEKDFDMAIHYFEEAIRIRNNGLAMYQIGDMYFYGEGFRRDFYEAFRWFDKALNEEEPMAMWRMGQKYDLFSSKFDLEENPKKAFAWYKKAAELGCHNAMESLGDLYNDYEDDVEHDEKRAFAWYEKAANLGNKDALGKLGEMYYYGKGTAIDRDTGLIMMLGAAPYSKIAQSIINRLENHLWFAKKDGDPVAHQRLKELKAAYKVFARDGNPFAEQRLYNEDFQYI